LTRLVKGTVRHVRDDLVETDVKIVDDAKGMSSHFKNDQILAALILSGKPTLGLPVKLMSL
jgi:hypothetical protein